ncbi:EPIDERMAL PATTERNING FACTOR-like protein 9 [Rhynchospora pubera]|uniref:EPIDERMAL PATTERNING FACTOR-like protein 9 n=1 Tax=Rhynchospora pubera TaxID=906938 RepID=A0AAV8G5D7_9POAL|nr:EPIDERMAL PATTERNING FACTOR-like protein 9 [Rhynchospora pubera]KAJ4798476.1 EPIDERMAL PATTERNING FACTOR-like protein 9 [Rhynchospora pubera]
MAKTSPKILFFLLSSLLFGALCRPDYEVVYSHTKMLSSNMEKQPEATLKKEVGLMGENGRKMIGSTAPACTFNECKGCKFKCSAEQVPVDASDPMNSAYRYKCICHR